MPAVDAARPIDFTKSTIASKLENLSLSLLLSSTRLTLKKLDLPVQERKRFSNLPTNKQELGTRQDVAQVAPAARSAARHRRLSSGT